MATLTLDKSRNALAVLAWRKGITIKPFNLSAQHALAKELKDIPKRKPRPLVLTKAQSLGVKRRR